MAQCRSRMPLLAIQLLTMVISLSSITNFFADELVSSANLLTFSSSNTQFLLIVLKKQLDRHSTSSAYSLGMWFLVLAFHWFFLSRDAMLARYVPSSRVCLSVTRRCSTETAKHRITQTTPHDSPGTLVFWRQRSRQNSNGVIPIGDAKCRSGRLTLTTFNK